MSENTSLDEPAPELTGVVELGKASEETRGSIFFSLKLDPVSQWPAIFGTYY